MSDELGDQDFWDRQWKRRIDRYLSAQPRTGLFIRHRFGSSCNKILELGGGSCRDSAYLAQKGYQCEATDLSPDAVSYLSSKFGSQNLEFSVQDAMNLSFADDSFELVFHNGLIVCFDSDEAVIEILREQRRVASRFALILAHNAENPTLVKQFSEIGETDPVFRIRFFSRDALRELMKKAGFDPSRITMEKFGGKLDVLAARKLKGVPNPFSNLTRRLIPSLYERQAWDQTERIACIAEL